MNEKTSNTNLLYFCKNKEGKICLMLEISDIEDKEGNKVGLYFKDTFHNEMGPSMFFNFSNEFEKQKIMKLIKKNIGDNL